MIEKRFNILSSYLGMYEIFDEKEGNPLAAYEVVDLLNELYDENMLLKEEVAYYKLLLMSLEEEAKRISQIR